LIVTGNTRITGILTIGTSSITLDGIGDKINVGTAVTINSSGIILAGVITATSFVGDGSGLTNLSSGIAGVNTTGTSTFNNLNVSGFSTLGATSATLLSISGVSTLSGGINASQGVDATGLRVTGITTLGQANITGLSNAGISTLGNATATTLVVSGVSTVGVVTGATYFGDASYIVSGKWTLGADGSSDYTFTGIGFTQTTNDPALYLARGAVYEFVNNMGAHPFRIQSTPNGSAGTQYNNGVTNNDVSNGTLRFEIPFNAPNTLYYQCTAHAGMGGTITIYPSI